MAHEPQQSQQSDDAWAQDVDYGSDEDENENEDMVGFGGHDRFGSDASHSIPGPTELKNNASSNGAGIGYAAMIGGRASQLSDQIGNLSLQDSDSAFSMSGGPGGGPLSAIANRINVVTEITSDLENPYDIAISHEFKIDKTEVTGDVSDDDIIANLKFNQFKLAGKPIKEIKESKEENNSNDSNENKDNTENKENKDNIESEDDSMYDEMNDPLLGEGAFAKVYRARDLDNGGRYVALKSMRKRDLAKKFVMKSRYDVENGIPVMLRSNVLDLVKNEIRIMLQLKHENVISLLGIIDDPRDDQLIMAIEYAPHGQVMDWHPKYHRYIPNKLFKIGNNDNNNNNNNNNELNISALKECEWKGQNVIENVEDDSKNNKELPKLLRFRETTAKILFAKLVEALLYLHTNRIIHRDLKPENLLLFPNNVVKLADFGTAEYFEENEQSILVDTMGTSYYWSPGACSNENRDAYADDVWALGIVLFALIYSIIPYFHFQEHLLFDIIAKKPVTIPSNKQYAASEQVKDLLAKLLAHDEKNRIKLENVKKHPWLKDIKWSNKEFENKVNFETKTDENEENTENNENENENDNENDNENNNGNDNETNKDDANQNEDNQETTNNANSSDKTDKNNNNEESLDKGKS